MNKEIRKWFIGGAIFTIIVGTLLHFVYDWSGGNPIVGIFGAVNESTWEHLKLLFWPTLIFAIIEYFAIGKKYNNFITATAVMLYAGIMLIIIIFYTYTGILGKNYLVLDILTFVISVILSWFIGYKITVSPKEVSKTMNFISLIAILLLTFAFVYFTFYPPKTELFKDPIDGSYGI